ncbi:TIGR04255 family protein [Rhodoplanes azumiensis]|uniref:TIGR04255 family protein n=1 Tax=Rhodoplanes azumiensis TaxID=1897628 RepID=A0ABW5AN08_9BRAD
MSNRPEDLPDFTTPPLNEVVLGVQYNTPRGYQQIFAGEVWSLFRDKFPFVEELPPIPPMFETFGLPQTGRINFGIVTGASHDRFWFLAPRKEQLIQFQNDRLLHNWRKIEGQDNQYPRYETIVSDFERELLSLEKYFEKFDTKTLHITQCEISYINRIIAVDKADLRPSEWLRIIDQEPFQPDDFSSTFRKTIRGSDGRPQGRLICEANTAVTESGALFVVLTLTARGAPEGHSIAAAIDFLNRGREIIVRQFTEITTDSAHHHWGRVR